MADGLIEMSKCQSIPELRKKIIKKTKVKVKTCDGNDLVLTPKILVDDWIKSMRFSKIPGLRVNSDLESGKYEGGFKVWEGTYDLLDFVNTNQDIINKVINRDEKLNVLELGAGASLVSIALWHRMARDRTCDAGYEIHIQDYNWQVLVSLTLMNYILNVPQETLQNYLESGHIKFLHGDWGSFECDLRYHLILMSEVIYNKDNYEALHSILVNHTKKKGYVVMATKDVYFGLTGSLQEWLDFIEEKSFFRLQQEIKVKSNNIPRSIIILKRRKQARFQT